MAGAQITQDAQDSQEIWGSTDEVREYANAHGVARGGTQRHDAVPLGPQPLLNPEAADEGLLTFVQSTTCRRRVWAEAFESPILIRTGESSVNAEHFSLS